MWAGQQTCKLLLMRNELVKWVCIPNVGQANPTHIMWTKRGPNARWVAHVILNYKNLALFLF